VQLSFSEEELIAHLDDELNVSIRQSIAAAPAMPALPPKKPQNFTRLPLRGATWARDELLLADIAQNLSNWPSLVLSNRRKSRYGDC